MVAFGKENREMNSAPFLIKAIEEKDNYIQFIISLPIEGKKGTVINNVEIPELNEILKESTPIFPNENNLYEIIFEDYIFHITRNESYTCRDDYEISNGKYFIIFERSRLLDCVPELVEDRLLGECYPAGWKHYGICCQNHIIDIISAKEPIIRKTQL